jgi:thymidylate synthase
MKVIFVEALDLPDAWYQCLNKVLEFGHEYTITRGSFKGQKRLELDYVTVQIKQPSNRPIIPDIPAGIGLPPPASLEYVERYMEYLITDFKRNGEAYTYGERLTKPKIWLDTFIAGEREVVPERGRGRRRARAHTEGKSVRDASYQLKLDTFLEGKRITGEVPYGVNQIDKVIEIYKKDGFETNQATMEIAMPSDIMLSDPPCLRLIDTRIRYGKLHFAVYFRSWDLWAGFPSNLAALQLLKEYMANEIGVDDGEIIAATKGLHLYEYAWEFAKIRTYRS